MWWSLFLVPLFVLSLGLLVTFALRPSAGRVRRGLVALLVVPMLAVACGDGGDGGDAGDAARDAAERTEEELQEAGESLQDAWATLRTEAEGLIDEIQTNNDPEAKQKLLDECRERLEQLRRAESASADRVDSLCNRIRDTEVSDRDAWNEIKDEISNIDVGA